MIRRWQTFTAIQRFRTIHATKNSRFSFTVRSSYNENFCDLYPITADFASLTDNVETRDTAGTVRRARKSGQHLDSCGLPAPFGRESESGLRVRET